jgi:hypothetical protein
MPTFLDVIVLALFAVAVVVLIVTVTRQRRMLRSPGAIALATRRGGHRWLYGIGQYAGGELRWYRALGLRTSPNWVLRRGDVEIVRHRPASASDLSSLPPTTVVVDLRKPGEDLTIALSDGAFTGFVSWLEASAPRRF